MGERIRKKQKNQEVELNVRRKKSFSGYIIHQIFLWILQIFVNYSYAFCNYMANVPMDFAIHPV